MEHNAKTLEHHLKGIKNVDETVVFRRPSVAREKLTGESVGLTEGAVVGLEVTGDYSNSNSINKTF